MIILADFLIILNQKMVFGTMTSRKKMTSSLTMTSPRRTEQNKGTDEGQMGKKSLLSHPHNAKMQFPNRYSAKLFNQMVYPKFIGKILSTVKICKEHKVEKIEFCIIYFSEKCHVYT